MPNFDMPSTGNEEPRRKKLKETVIREASIGPVDSALRKRAEWMVEAAGVREALGPKIVYDGEPRFGRVKRGVSVLCVGAGKGHEMDEIDAMLPGSKVLGVDPHDAQTRPVKKRLETLAHDARYLPETSSAEDLRDVPDGSLDGATFFFVLHHVDQSKHDRIMEEMRRVLKPDGQLFIAEDLADSDEERKVVEKIDRRLNFEFGADAPHHYRSIDEWSAYFRANGFEIVRAHEEKPDKVRHGFFVLKRMPETQNG